MNKVFRVIILITLPIALIMIFASLLTTKQYLMISENKYESHERVYFDYEFAADRIMGYLNYRYDSMDFEIEDNYQAFNRTQLDDYDGPILISETGNKHMEDVKNLYTTLRLVAIFSLIIAVSLLFYQYKTSKKELYKTFKLLPLGPIFFVLFVGTFMIIDFDATFTKFHELFFNNDDWMLPSLDVLLIILPEMFWLVSGLIILGLFICSIVTIYLLNEKILKKHYLNEN